VILLKLGAEKNGIYLPSHFRRESGEKETAGLDEKEEKGRIANSIV
jgi:hypothetical protein